MNDTFFRTGNNKKIQNLFDIFPVGMMIFEKIKAHPCSDLKLSYINETASKILGKSNSKSEEEIDKTLKKFNKLKQFSTIKEVYSDMNDVTEENLYNRIFDDLDQTETEICERYISKEIMIYVKIKIHQEYKLVTIENFNDERIAIQNNIIKNIKTQYLLTLSHELNNPLNSLAHSVNEIISTKDERKEKKRFLNEMKINIGLIKFFIKNFIFSVKMSFDMNTVIKADIEKKQEDCVNLEYVFRKIKEKYSIFFLSKKIKTECDFNLMETIYVTYDYDYLKSMIKNIFMFLFYRIDRNGGLVIELQFEKELKIMFKKNIKKHNENYLVPRKLWQTNHLDTSFINELDIESSVKTLKILNDIIKKFAAMLGIRVNIIEDESPCYLILYLKYDIDEDFFKMGQDLDEEFTNRDSKKRNVKQLNTSISIILEPLCDNNKSLLKQSKNIFNEKSLLISDRSFNASSDLGNISSIGSISNMKMNHDNSIGDQILEKNEKGILSQKGKPKQKPRKYDKNMTVAKKLKQTATINSDYENKLATNERPETMIVRSNFTFTLITNESNRKEVDVMVDVVLDKTSLNAKFNEHNSSKCLNIVKQDNNENLAGNNVKKESAIKINNSINKTNDNCAYKNENNSKGSKFPLKKTTSNSSLNKQSISKNRLSSSNLMYPVKVISQLSQQNINVFSQSNSSSTNQFDLINSIKTAKTISASDKSSDILVVDDDSFNLNVIQSMLKKLKINSDTCMNGLECLNKVKSNYEKGSEYKLILMDVMMPIMDGIQASTKIEELVKSNKLNSNIKIIIISAHNNQEIINRATKLSVVKEFLSKPVKRGDIQRIINNNY